MSSLAGRVLQFPKSRFLPRKSLGILRLSTYYDPCPPKCPPPSSPSIDGKCPEPPPCCDQPPTAHRLCPQTPDPGNPCNYYPPPCPDPDYPDLTRLKKLQCLFQEDNDLPVFLKGGGLDNLIYQTAIILNSGCLIAAFYFLYCLI